MVEWRKEMTKAVMMTRPMADADVRATTFIDADHPDVQAFARQATAASTSATEAASHLFAAVRDEIRYDPYAFDLRPASMRASVVLRGEPNWCVPKAVLLAAACRAVGIPARLGFADVRNHLSSAKLEQVMGTDVFVWHGYTMMRLEGRWCKASPAFNAELCARFGVPPLEFDGTGDALLHAYDGQGRRHMEYLDDHGSFADLPLSRISDALRAAYPTFTEGVSPTSDPAFHDHRSEAT